jgi:hypothetical protein
MVMIPGELIAAANNRESHLHEKNRALTLRLLQVTQTLAAVVEELGTVTDGGKYIDFDADRLEQVFFDPFVAIAPTDPEKKTIRLFRPSSGSGVGEALRVENNVLTKGNDEQNHNQPQHDR